MRLADHLFKRHRFERPVMVRCVRWYVTYKLSYCDLVEMMAERGKYHVVFIPKCRRRALYEQLRQHLGEVFRRLAAQKESQIEEGHLRPDRVPMRPGSGTTSDTRRKRTSGWTR
jgi:hypothetical protein